jgi:cytochrome c oxidase assembly factor CtaG
VASPDASWTFEPGVIALTAIAGYAYVRRWRAAREQAGPRAASGWRLASFAAGLATVLVALISPVDRLAEQLLLMHMVQHLLLLDIASILLLLGLTRVILRPVTRYLEPAERRAGVLGHPVTAVVAYVGIMWVWHVPALYDAAVRHSGLHVLEHLTMAGAGVLYWWHILGPIRSRLRLSGMAPMAYMASTKLLVGILGIVLTFAPDALYPYYESQPHFWGLTPSEDEAIAGLIMALEQSIIMGIAAAWLFTKLLGESEREEERAERYGSDVAEAGL